nr:histidine kinase-, DNA gyrase B-, and HSP90-like ATPase family protein [Tanacetum cinerariifolium]
MYDRPPFNRRNNHQPQPQPPPPPYLNQLNYLLNNFYNQQQQPNFPIPNPNPNITTQYFNPPIESSSQTFNPYNQVSPNNNNNRHVLIERIDKAAAKARRDLIANGGYVSVIKVSQDVLLALESCSWDALGVQMQHVPALYSLIMIEGKINAFINCFIRVWKVTTLADLEAAICKNEGVQQFEELELGPLIRHPLINDYFCVSPDSTRAFEISSQEVLNYLVEFMGANKGAEIKADELLDFIARERSVDSKEKLHVRIQSLGLHISFIRQARPMEVATIKKYIPSSDKKSKKRPLFTSQKKQLDDNFSVISKCIKSFSTEHGNKHIRFKSSSEDEDNVEDNDDDIETDDNEDEACLTSQSKNSSQEMKSSDRVSSCPYPSAIEEKTRLGILGEKEESPSLDNNEGKKRSNKKRKVDAIDSTSNVSRKSPKGGSDKQGYVGINLSKKVRCKGKHPADMSLDNDSMTTFITLWKDRCKGKDVFKVMKQMTRFYKPDMPKIPKKLSRELYKSYPLVGLINVAIRSIKRGMWDSMYDTLQALEQGEAVQDSMDHTDNVTIETEQTDTQLVNKNASKQHCEVSLEDILKKVSDYLKDNHDVSSDSNSVFGRNAFFHRNLFKCEVWITQQFAVENFESFGHGDFLTLLERKVSELPSFVQKYLGSNGTHDKPSLKASMSHQLLDLLVAQASHSLSEKESLSLPFLTSYVKLVLQASLIADGTWKPLNK